MADLAVGINNGVAKEALLTAVQVDAFTFEAQVKTELEASLEAISLVVDSIYIRRKSPNFSGEKHVVSMSFEVTDRGTPSDASFISAFLEALKELDEHGVALVTGMPNGVKCTGIPCGYSAQNDPKFTFLPNLITVGSSRIDNGAYVDDLEDIDSLDRFTIFGPGDDQKDGGEGKPGIVCADFQGDKNSGATQRGTSHGNCSCVVIFCSLLTVF